MTLPDAARERFGRYTRETLAWSLGQPASSSPPPEDAEQARRAADRAVRVHAASKRASLLLLGLGDGTLARML